MERHHVAVTRAAYDTVAADYARLVGPLLDDLPLDRALLAAFAELCRGARVADVGCGPGLVTAYLHDLGADVVGLDLSPAMIGIARRAYPGRRFEVGTMTDLPVPDGALGGILAWYSVIHIPPAEQPALFAEFRRALAPGGHLLLGFHVGDDERHRLHRAYGHEVSYDVYRLSPDRVAQRLRGAGLAVTTRVIQEPEDPGQRRHACVLARAVR